MRPRPTFLSSLLTTLFLLAILSTSLSATAAQLEPIEQTVWSDGVEFSTSGKYDGLVLTVGEPDGIVSRTAIESTAIDFRATDDEGKQRPDGVYSYRLEGVIEGKSQVLRTGHFSIAGGRFVPNDVEESSQSIEKTLIDDNLSVRNSVCIGGDCLDNETYGFETLKLKENNLRIVFQDTSSSGSFPSTDWMLKANETANEGADLFSIVNCDLANGNCEGAGAPFTILGTAPEHSLYVGGEAVGFGTNTPALELHVLDGDTPSLRLEQDASIGFAKQTWDIGGNESYFFIRDVTGSYNKPFKIEPGAANDALVINSQGDIEVAGTVDGRDVAADGDVLDSHVADSDNPHQVTAEQVGAVSQAALDAHALDSSNPHQVTAEQVGAVSQAALDAHALNLSNPHQVTAEQVGAVSQAALDAHALDFSNPHGVTADLVGAEPAGTAALVAANVMAAHEASYDHSTLASSLPVPVSEGGTGATDAATARANLGIADDAEKAGIVYAADFAGNPATATVQFDNPYPPGTVYAVTLTSMTSDSKKIISPSLTAKDENGFTITLGARVGTLVEVDWQARPIGD